MENNSKKYRFLFFENKQTFDEKISNGEIRDGAIAFIKGETENERAIWTHNTFFKSGGEDHSKGFFVSEEDLRNSVPYPNVGDWAIVANQNIQWLFGDKFPVYFALAGIIYWIYVCKQAGQWEKTKLTYEGEDINARIRLNAMQQQQSRFITRDQLDQSGFLTPADFKTINGESILGDGNLSINTTGTIPTTINTSDIQDEVLEKSQDVINSEFRRDIDAVTTTVNNDSDYELIQQLREQIQILNDKINAIFSQQTEEGEYIYFAFLTQAQYDELEEHDPDTLYFIIAEDHWGFGDAFDITLSDDSWQFGDAFDITLAGETTNTGDEEFPVTLT